MRARSREVNIFNMSLLDILTGMLGAFLFLMLGLVPYYSKAKHGGGGGNQQPAVDMSLNVITRWDSNAKVDIFLHGDGGWCGGNAKSIPLSSRATISPNACPRSDTWAVTSIFASVGDRYLLAISPQGPFDPEALRHMRFSIELLEAESKPDGSGIKSYYPDVWVSTFDASGTKPNTVYGIGWIDVTKDTSKSANVDDFNLQYDYTFKSVKDGESLPDGAIPLPAGAPMSVTLVPSGSSAPTAAPAPDSAPPPTPDNSPPSQPTPTPSAPPEKPSMWNPFNWFFHSSPPSAPNQR
jgi:hypothetical protein